MGLLKIIDSHLHFYDCQANQHTFLEERDLNYEAFVGDYSQMPRKYLLKEYLEDSAATKVEGVVWHEFLSMDPLKEAKWAQELCRQQKLAHALVVWIDFLDPKLEQNLEFYSTLPNVSAVREHMVWDNQNPRKRFAKRPDLLQDSIWQDRLTLLNRYHFKCGLEVFAPQLPDLIKVIRANPHIGFTIALMGWPLDLSAAGYQCWKKDLSLLSDCDNICIDISAIECIFGMNWTAEQVRPWLLSTIEIIGPARCMFGSHMPIAKLSRSFSQLYEVYQEMVKDFSQHEQADLFCNVAAKWFGIHQS